jgi:hypothetical protein
MVILWRQQNLSLDAKNNVRINYTMNKMIKINFISILLMSAFLNGCDEQQKLIDVYVDPDPTGLGFYERCAPDEPSDLAIHHNIDHLIITEFSPMTAINRSVWLEIFNPTASPIELSNIQLRSYAIVSDREPTSNDIILTPTLFNLPENILEPYGHLIIESVISRQVTSNHSTTTGDTISTQLVLGEPINTDHYIRLSNGAKTFFWRHDAGLIELVDKSTGNTIDFIHFGSDTQTPLSTSQWSGHAIPVYQHANRSKTTSTARIVPYQDSDNLADWSLSTFVTRSGANLTFPMVAGKMDLTLTDENVDLDKDGIPDSKEVDCAYFNDLPYYGWGARPNQTDIFVQVDYMEDSPTTKVTNLMQPSVAALQKWENIYIQYSLHDVNHASGPLYPIRFHIDTGLLHALPDEQNVINNVQYHLHAKNTSKHGGTVVPYQESIYLSHYSEHPTIATYASINMDPRRYGIFHYLLAAYKYAASDNAVGLADNSGQNSGVFMSIRDRISSLDNNRGAIDTLFASTAAHEVGHNLSLHHGGFEEINYKPNYYSIMNYGYSDDMVKRGAQFTQAEINTIKAYHRLACSGDEYFRFANIILANAYYNFSDGSGHDIDLSNINESNQYLNRQLGTLAIDYNNNGTIETNMSCNLAGKPRSSTFKDSNDWVMMRDTAYPRRLVSHLNIDTNGLPVAEPDNVVVCEK